MNIHTEIKSVESISYEIIKVQGGEIRAESKEGKLAEFIMYLPFKNLNSILMKLLFKVCLLVLFSGNTSAQQDYLDSLYQQINSTKDDTTKVLALSELALYYGFNQFDSSIFYANQAIDLSKKLNYLYGSYLGLQSLFIAFNCQGNFPKALAASLQNLEITEKIKKNKPYTFIWVNYSLGLLNREMGNFSTAIFQLQQAIRLNKAANQPEADLYFCYSHLALAFKTLNQKDSALWYAQKAYELSLQSKRYPRYVALSAAVLGETHNELGHPDFAKRYFSVGVQQSKKYNNTFFLARNYNNLADLFNKINYLDSSIYYARLSLQLCQEHKFSEYALNASSLLTKVFESQNKPDSTVKYMRIMLSAKDSVLGQSKVKDFQKFLFDDEQRRREIEKEQDQYINKIKTYAFLLVMIALSLIAFILWRNNRQKQDANLKIEKAYKDLKATQSQLIQSEKMASLGELTAGIAHEIQNPLNFVNNFSEVNKELLVELKDEIDKGNLTDAKSIANDVIENQEKINHHGKRADTIVKGMLQHSRTSSGQKELTDLNVLADEYLRLAYQGLRVKDKFFNAEFETDFDQSIGKINIIPQDIGRVILNLINNAFYAVSEKKNQAGDARLPDLPIGQEGGQGYEPIVSVSTRKIADKVLISVKDNGNGIPQKIVDKIFQPFFTTKPTGLGTGLGLSLSYDIVKAHGGEIQVNTKEGEGSEFIIQLPVDLNQAGR